MARLGEKWRTFRLGGRKFTHGGYSNSNRSTDINAPLSLVKGIDIIPYCFCPHYNEQERKAFDDFVKTKELEGIAIEDNCALIYEDDEIVGIIKSDNNAKGYIINKNEKKELKEV